MKKIPGTMYHIGITNSRNNKFNLCMWYRNEVILEKTGLIEVEMINIIQDRFESRNLSIPRNRIEWIIKQELDEISPTSDITFVEGTVSEMLGEFQKSSSNDIKKIILIGLSNAGKTCIYERVFEGKKPWELMHSASTKGISYKKYKVGSMSKPMIWDLGGQQQYFDDYHTTLRTDIFKKASILLFVFDVTDVDRFENSRFELEWSANQAKLFNPDVIINVLFHKIDLIHDKDALISYLKTFLSQNISHKIMYHPTSIFDESLFKVWSEIIREISPKTTFINSILKLLKDQPGVQDVVLIERSTGLACGSTLEQSEEDIFTGMLSLLTITIDKVTREMKFKNFKEFRLKTDSNTVLLTNVTDDLMLAIILTSASLHKEVFDEIEKSGFEVTNHIRKLWAT